MSADGHLHLLTTIVTVAARLPGNHVRLHLRKELVTQQVTQQKEIEAALKVWRESLVGVTGQSQLIKFRETKTTSLRIELPSNDEILTAIRSGRPQTFVGETKQILSTGSVEPSISKVPALNRDTFYTARPDKEVGPFVRNLMRRTNAEFLDRGLAVLYVAFGTLHWQDEDDSAMTSPIFLVPVKLQPEGPHGTPRIVEGDDDPVINPALILRLKSFGIEIPPYEELEGQSATAVLSATREAIQRRHTFKNWELLETAHLARFSFAKEAMFKDLLDNHENVLNNPIVRALATSDPRKQATTFQFEPISAEDIDQLTPTDQTPFVLDADSSQRVAVAAALNGKTFVMDGPPGTGKSQTIANTIGALLHAGKTVLFVSEKMAALDVVRNRLDSAGLGSYLLELHSHKASRKEVAAELLRTLENISKPPPSMAEATKNTLRKRQQQLSDYAEAMNTIREPLGMSLHSVLGEYSKLASFDIAPTPGFDILELSDTDFHSIQENLRQLVRAWRPALQGSSFLWRNVVDESSLEVRLHQALAALEELNGTVEIAHEMVVAFGLTRVTQATQLDLLLKHQRSRPESVVLDSWLNAETFSKVKLLRNQLEGELRSQAAATTALSAVATVAWSELPNMDPYTYERCAEDLVSPQLDIANVHVAQIEGVIEKFESDSSMLSELLRSLGRLSSVLGQGQPATLADVDSLNDLVSMRERNTRPEKRWFSPHGLAEARVAATSLKKLISRLKSAEGKATVTFNSSALTAPLGELQDRFENLHKGLRKLSKSYRTDKATVSHLLSNANDVKTGIKHFSDAIAWSEASAAFEEQSANLGPLLGRHWKGRDTNFKKLRLAFTVVEEVLAHSGEYVPSELVTYMSSEGPETVHREVLDSVRASLDTWKASLAPAPELTGRPEHVLIPISDAIHWMRAQLPALKQATARIHALDKFNKRDSTLADVTDLLALANCAREADQTLLDNAQSYGGVFGHLFRRSETSLADIDCSIEWVETLLSLNGGQISPTQLMVLASSEPLENLELRFEKWREARDHIVAAFDRSRQRELLNEFDDFSTAVELLEEFKTDTIGQQEWFDYQHAYSALKVHSLDTAVDFCSNRKLGLDDIIPVITRALLRGWSDAVIRTDKRLTPIVSRERDTLVEEFQAYDRDVLKAATGEIISAANRRRPANSSIGESAIIRREGAKQRRHMSVRDLMAATSNVTTSIKPVFMMSPLAVSQFLPPDINFDVVIFDEASQVTPGDAINCVYRGKSLILAGDDKQLPPTSFFDRVNPDDESEVTDVGDFQSVLELAKASGAFNNLGLRWHYRSRHEDLIAFSNYKFYEGKLITFPSAQVKGNDVGVEFFNANGTYLRGGGAYNPIEAQRVAERVMEHFSTRPEQTLGVVTFSVSQADAVQRAIDLARTNYRHLDHHFDTDNRLDGFFIRALEQVQGDERDVIIFSIGYGPDEAGKISTNFGALNRDKGWRRLNVGITRARKRVEVVASMIAGQIPPSSNENVEFFRAYLDYAEKGQEILAVPYSSTGLDTESPFEDSVLSVLRNWGYTVEPQVGAAGYRIDLGVRHPDYPGMFAIGIECDGYQYHSAPAARDRDRLRDQILNQLGWRLHRIWGTAWYRDRAAEEIRLRAAIEDAIQAPIESRTKALTKVDHPIVETEISSASANPSWTSPYTEAEQMSLPYWVVPGELGNHMHMIKTIEAIVRDEGPVHTATVDERLRYWWNVGRIGSKIRQNIDLAITRSDVQRIGDFLFVDGSSATQVRTPTATTSRKIEHIHMDELGLAAFLTVRDAGAAREAEVIQAVARIFGFNKTSQAIEARIRAAIDSFLGSGSLVYTNSSLTVATTA